MTRYLCLTVLALGCCGCTTTKQPSPAAMRTNTQSLNDKQMLAKVEAEVLGLQEAPALKRLKDIGFSDGSVSSKAGEGRRVWCMKKDYVSSLVEKKWNVVLLVDKSGKVSSVEVSSGLVGP